MPANASKCMQVRLDVDLVNAIDEVRGDVPRERYVRALLRRALLREGLPVEKPIPKFNRVTSLRR